MSDRRGIHVSDATQKAIDTREKKTAKLNAKIEKAAEKADAEEKKRA